MSLGYEHGMADSGPTAGRSGISDVLSARAREGVLRASVEVHSFLTDAADRSPGRQWCLAVGAGFTSMGLVEMLSLGAVEANPATMKVMAGVMFAAMSENTPKPVN